MRTKKQKTLKGSMLVFLLLLIPSMLYAGCTGSSPTWTCTADTSSTNLQTCITGAKDGDTINIGEGTGTWNTRIQITKAVKLIGAGIDKTIINNSYSPSMSGGSFDATKHLISIIPATPANNPSIRISGFTFNFGSSSYGIFYANLSTTYDCTNVRLDHLDISSPTYVFQRYGLAHGVMDNCIIKGRMDGGGYAALWTTNEFEFGTESNFYIEDCTWSSYSNTTEMYIAGNGAHRYAFRHNTINIPTGVQIFPLFDQHGNSASGGASCFGAEIYENTISVNGNAWTTLLFDQRGGKSLVYNNTIKWTTGGGVATRLREEHQDSDGEGAAVNVINGQPQHISDSYYWGNTKNGALLVPSLVNEIGVPDSISGENVPTNDLHVWIEKPSFDGTSGVGVGLRSARPATCASTANANYPNRGVGYWATDEKILYRCTAGTWTAYYTPLAYPHPLRTENYRPPTIAVSPATKDFGALPINTSSPVQKFTVTTSGGNLSVDALSMTGTDAKQFTIQNNSCTGSVIAPETGSCTFDVKFTPSSVGAKTANVSIVDNDSNTTKLIALNGTGTSQVPAMSFSPTSLSFSSVLSGTLSSPKTITLSNTGASFVTISSLILSGTNANQFSIPAATDYCTGETVAAAGNCSFQVIFSPTSGGAKTANVNLTALYYGSPAAVPIYGAAVVYQAPVPRIKISKRK